MPLDRGFESSRAVSFVRLCCLSNCRKLNVDWKQKSFAQTVFELLVFIMKMYARNFGDCDYFSSKIFRRKFFVENGGFLEKQCDDYFWAQIAVFK
jgi:hypothetical protein